MRDMRRSSLAALPQRGADRAQRAQRISTLAIRGQASLATLAFGYYSDPCSIASFHVGPSVTGAVIGHSGRVPRHLSPPAGCPKASGWNAYIREPQHAIVGTTLLRIAGKRTSLYRRRPLCRKQTDNAQLRTCLFRKHAAQGRKGQALAFGLLVARKPLALSKHVSSARVLSQGSQHCVRQGPWALNRIASLSRPDRRRILLHSPLRQAASSKACAQPT